MLLDFHAFRVTSLVTDLCQLIYSSKEWSMRSNKIYQLILNYHKTFHDIIKNANVKCPFTYDELRKEFDRKREFGFLFGIGKFFKK